MVATIKRVIGTILLAGMTIPVSVAHADRPSPSPSNRPVNLCYCRCNTSHSKQACTKMCELPKYESRWWASSCHKRTPPPAKKSPESRPHPPKHSGGETARRQRIPLPSQGTAGITPLGLPPAATHFAPKTRSCLVASRLKRWGNCAAAVDAAQVFGPGAFSAKAPAANENGGLQCRGRTGCLAPEVLFASVHPAWPSCHCGSPLAGDRRF